MYIIWSKITEIVFFDEPYTTDGRETRVTSLCKLKGQSAACSVIYGLVIEGQERY